MTGPNYKVLPSDLKAKILDRKPSKLYLFRCIDPITRKITHCYIWANNARAARKRVIVDQQLTPEDQIESFELIKFALGGEVGETGYREIEWQ